MEIIIIDHLYKKLGKAELFSDYSRRKLKLTASHGCQIISVFSPVELPNHSTPDEIQIIKLPSRAALDVLNKNLNTTEMLALKNEAVRLEIRYQSVQIDLPAHELETVVSQRSAANFPTIIESSSRRPETIVDLEMQHPPHPAQNQAVIETRLLNRGDVIQQTLGALVEKWQAQNDRRVIFVHTYYLMTTNMLQALDNGEFHDRKWVSTLLRKFAGFYLEALREFEQAWYTAPPTWRIAFQVAKNPQSMTFQHLLLGVNAHINYDLVKTLVYMLKDEWRYLSDDEKKHRYADHTHVNKVIARTLEETQEQVIARYSPTLDALNKLALHTDEFLVSSLINHWREQVWQHAVKYLEAETVDQRDVIMSNVEYIALRRADIITLKHGPINFINLE